MSFQISSEPTRSPAWSFGLDAGGGNPVGFGPSAPGAGKHASARHILVVEDDRSIREAVQIALEDEGYRVVCADHGLEALDLLRSERMPDLIVLDLRMPVMDGWEFRAAQKRDPELAGIPVVAVSADDSAKAAAIDAHAYLQKPLSTTNLVNTINRVLGDPEEQPLTGRRAELEPLSAVARLASTVSQEIDGPLTYLTINVDLVAQDIDRLTERSADGEARLDRRELGYLGDLLYECRGGLDRIRNAVSNLKTLSGNSPTEREWFHLEDVLDRAIGMGGHRADNRAAIVKRYGDAIRMHGDPTTLCRVFLNLLSNAVEALPEGRPTEHEITVRSFARGATVIVEVSDTGPRIPGHLLPRIFEPLFLNRSLGEATGLGLAAAARIVLEHGGRIDAFNNPDRGATFRVTLPVSMETKTSDEEPAPLVAGGSHGRVLVIDNEPVVAQAIEAALESEHEVVGAQMANEAFSHLASGERFDVILCDLALGDMTGREVYEALIARWPNAARNLVFMASGSVSIETSQFITRARRRILRKPFRVEDLRAVVRAQMDDQVERRN